MKKLAYIFTIIVILTALTSKLSISQNPNTYTVKHGETYYSIARNLKINPKELIKANNAKALFPGDTVILPTNTSFIEHTVKAKETLFKIAKDYNVSVDAIKKDNKIDGDTIKIGQILKIAKTINQNKNATVKNTSTASVENQHINSNITVLENKNNDTTTINNNVSNRDNKLKPSDTAIYKQPTNLNDQKNINNSSKQLHPTNNEAKTQLKTISSNTNTASSNQTDNKGIIQQQGIGTWLSDADLNFSKSVALHNQATIGTIIKVTNPMSRRSIYAKVIGKFDTNENNKDAIIVISQSAATLLGVLDKRFRVILEYVSN